MGNLPILDAHAAFIDVGSEQMHGVEPRCGQDDDMRCERSAL